MGRYDEHLGIGADEIIGADDSELLEEILSGEGSDDYGDIGASEIIGNDELEDGEELAIGVSPRRKRALKQRILARNAKIIAERKFDKIRKYLLGIEQLAVAAAAQANINGTPQYLFRPYRYIIPSTFAPNFVLDAINIGQQPVFVAAGDVPAEAFTEVAVGVQVLWDTASIGNQVTVQTTNISGAAADFRSVMLGVVGKA